MEDSGQAHKQKGLTKTRNTALTLQGVERVQLRGNISVTQLKCEDFLVIKLK